MLTSFPRRSYSSDDQAQLVKAALDGIPSAAAGEAFMVSVVTSQSGRCFIGLSGSHSDLADQLKAALSICSHPAVAAHAEKAVAKAGQLSRTVNDNKVTYDIFVQRHVKEFAGAAADVMPATLMESPLAAYFDPEAQAARFGARVVKVGMSRFANWNADVSRTNLTWKGEWLARDARANEAAQKMKDAVTGADPKATLAGQVDLQSGRDAQLKAVHDQTLTRAVDPRNIKPNWNCSEPKALIAIAETGEVIDGMTTFWYGTQADAVFDKYKFDDRRALRDKARPAGVPGPPARPQLLLCKPCETCAQNESRIMATVSLVRGARRGGGGKMIWAEAPT